MEESDLDGLDTLKEELSAIYQIMKNSEAILKAALALYIHFNRPVYT